MIEEEKLKKINKYAEEKLKNNDYNHDIEHPRRAANLIEYITKKEKANLDICKVAALLHDVGQSEGMKNHNERGAEMVRIFLPKIGFDKEFTEKVSYCILHHDTSKINEAKTIEAKALYDADILQTLGPFGFVRMLTTFTVFEKMNLKDALRKVREFENIVLQHLQTKTAKKMIKKENKLMEKFYKMYDKWDKVKL